MFNFYLYTLPPPSCNWCRHSHVRRRSICLCCRSRGPNTLWQNQHVRPRITSVFQRTGPGCFFREIHNYSVHPSTNQAREHPQISINGTIVPLENSQKSLESPTTPCIPFTPHCRIQAAKVRARNNLLKGQQKETLWAAVINDSTWKYLQTAQNEALRIATGCHKMSNTIQNSPNNTGFLATKYQPHHPCHQLTTLPAPARNTKGTLMKFNSEIVP